MARKDLPELPPYVPSEIQRRLDNIENAVGQRPELTEIGPRDWHIELVGPRLRLTMDYSYYLGKKRRYESELYVDGQQTEKVADVAELKKLWEKLHDPNYVEPELPELPPTPAHDTFPKVVDSVYHKFASVIPTDAENVQYACWPEGDLWVFGMNVLARKAHLRIEIGKDGRGRWSIIGVNLMLDGIDRSAAVGNSMESLVQVILGMLAPPSASVSVSGPIVKGRSAPKTRANSVIVRNTTVIRN